MAITPFCKNSPPQCPESPTGVTIGGPNLNYCFTAIAFDPEGDSLALRFSWSDGDTSAWSCFVPSGESVAMNHSWVNPGNYQVKVQAQDKNARLTAWSRPLYLTIIPEGNLKWRIPLGNDISFFSPAITADGAVIICAGFYDGNSYYLYAINPDGTLKWRTALDDESTSPVINSDGAIYLLTYWGTVYSINPDGSIRWRTWIPPGWSCTASTPAVNTDWVSYMGGDGFYAVSPDGRLRCQLAPGDFTCSSPAIGPDGTVYIGSSDGYLYAIQGSGTLANSPWPKFHHDNQNTGRVGGGN